MRAAETPAGSHFLFHQSWALDMGSYQHLNMPRKWRHSAITIVIIFGLSHHQILLRRKATLQGRAKECLGGRGERQERDGVWKLKGIVAIKTQGTSH